MRKNTNSVDASGSVSALVWFICSFSHVTLDTSITDYNLYFTTELIMYGYPPNII